MADASAGQNFVQAIDLSGRLIRSANFMLDHWWLWLSIALVLWISLKIRAQHALIARLDERADAAFGDVDALLTERHALIGNLVEIVRAFAAQERSVISEVLNKHVEAVAAIGNAGIMAETQIANSLQNLFAVSEQYPELAAEGHYTNLRQDLVRIEDRITAARKFYNLAVEEMNSVRRAFPGNVIARLTSVGGREKFTLGAQRTEMAQPVKVSL
jgi:LemA protein